MFSSLLFKTIIFTVFLSFNVVHSVVRNCPPANYKDGDKCTVNCFGAGCKLERPALLTSPEILSPPCQASIQLSFDAFNASEDIGSGPVRRYEVFVKLNGTRSSVKVISGVNATRSTYSVYTDPYTEVGNYSFAVRSDYYYESLNYFENGSEDMIWSPDVLRPCVFAPENVNVTTSGTNLIVNWSPGYSIFYVKVVVFAKSRGNCEQLESSRTTTFHSFSSGTALITGLFEWTHYEVNVSVVTDPSSTKESVVSSFGDVLTDESVPKGGVKNLVLSKKTTHSVVIKWSPPDCSQRNGVLVTYDITLSPPKGPDRQSTTDQITLDGLTSSTIYTVGVFYRNGKGQGPPNYLNFTTAEATTTTTTTTTTAAADTTTATTAADTTTQKVKEETTTIVNPPTAITTVLQSTVGVTSHPITITSPITNSPITDSGSSTTSFCPACVPDQPRDLQILSKTNSTVFLGWTSPSDANLKIKSYEVVLLENGAIKQTITTQFANTTLENLTQEILYSAKVRVIKDDASKGTSSSEIQFKTLFLVARSVTTTTAIISWEIVDTSNLYPEHYTIDTIQSTSLLPAPITFNPISEVVPISNQTWNINGLHPASKYITTVCAKYTDGKKCPLPTSYWTRPGPIDHASIPPLEVVKLEPTQFTVLMKPVLNYNGGRLTGYFVGIEKNTVVRRRRGVYGTTPSDLGLPSDAYLVYGSSTAPKKNGTSVTIGVNQTSATNNYTSPSIFPVNNYTLYYVVRSCADVYCELATTIIKIQTPPMGKDVPSNNTLVLIIALAAVFLVLIILLFILLFYFCVYRRRRDSQLMVKFPLSLAVNNFNYSEASTERHLVPHYHKNWSTIYDLLSPRFIILDLDLGTPRDFKIDSINRTADVKPISFEKEFHNLPCGLQGPHSIASRPANLKKNRNPQLVPYDHSRVVLQRHNLHSSASDYINASFVDGYIRRKAYIAAQSPFNLETLRDFWLMIYQNHVGQIVMMTESLEDATLKCSQYWPEFDPTNPDGQAEEFDTLTVRITNQIEYAHFIVRHLIVTSNELGHDDTQQEVTQFQFLGWPHEGVPDSPLPLLELFNLVKMRQNIKDGPILVHCGTGTSRSAVFIGVDSLMQQAIHENVVNVYRFCLKMRRFRSNMIRTARQYMFLYDVLFEGLLATNNLVNLDVRESFKLVCEKNPRTLRTYLWEQYHVLDKYTHRPTSEECRTASSTLHASRNRVFSILAPDQYRVHLQHPAVTDYINAVWLEGVSMVDDVIMTQTPLLNTVQDFWTMIEQEQVTCIVDMQECCYGMENAVQYFPTVSNDSVSYPGVAGGLVIRSGKVTQLFDGKVVIRDLKVESSSVGVRNVSLYQLVGTWNQNDKVPEDRISLVQLVHTVLAGRLSGPLLVHCLDGASRSGLYVACHVTAHKLSLDQYVDVFHTIKTMKLRRYQILTSLDQYKFLYKFLWDWVRHYLSDQLQEAQTTNTLQGHISPSNLESIYTHVKYPVLHVHHLQSLEDLVAEDVAVSSDTGLMQSMVSNTSQQTPIHYHYADDEN